MFINMNSFTFDFTDYICSISLFYLNITIYLQNLVGHPKMIELDLSCNPIGEAGARALYRKMIRNDTNCIILMHGCTYSQDSTLFDYTDPDMASPYMLDLTDQYSLAVLSELSELSNDEFGRYHFINILYKENIKGNFAPLNSSNQGGGLMLKASGCLKIDIARFSTEPNANPFDSHNKRNQYWALKEKGLSKLKYLLEQSSSDEDRRHWLRLACEDILLTTKQVTYVIFVLIPNSLNIFVRSKYLDYV